VSALSIEDRIDIARVIAKYAFAIDSRDWSMLDEVFTPDAIADYGANGGIHEGIAAIKAVLMGAVQSLTATQHLMGTSLVDGLEPGRASGRTHLIANHIRTGHPGGERLAIAGTYSDLFVQAENGWRITRRNFEATWQDGNPGIFAPSEK
jgi:ketosteroid isomerase-like protein